MTLIAPAPARSSIVFASVTFWMPGPEATRLPFSSAIVLTGLSLGTRNSSSTYFALLGFVAKILNSPGCAISPIARFAEPVPLALPSERPESIASITCWAPANFSGSTSSPASLK